MLTVIISGVFTGCLPVDTTIDSEPVALDQAMPANDGQLPPVEEMIVERGGMMGRGGNGMMVFANKYKDGTYEEIGAYQSPAGAETLGVKVTVKDDVVTSLTVTNKATDEVSIKLQDMFIQGINTLVIGKKLENLDDFTVVNGASLTPAGFNNAIKAIKVDAENAS